MEIQSTGNLDSSDDDAQARIFRQRQSMFATCASGPDNILFRLLQHSVCKLEGRLFGEKTIRQTRSRELRFYGRFRCNFDSLVQSDSTHNGEGVAGVDFNFETLLVRDVNV